MAEKITVSSIINVPVETAWEFWTNPTHIMHWNNASDDWHTPKAENDLQVGRKFSYIMAAKDGSFSFDFNGIYYAIKPNELIAYNIEGGREVEVIFEANGNQTKVTETFEAETENPIEMQKAGWQAILDNFKKYTESNN